MANKVIFEGFSSPQLQSLRCSKGILLQLLNFKAYTTAVKQCRFANVTQQLPLALMKAYFHGKKNKIIPLNREYSNAQHFPSLPVTDFSHITSKHLLCFWMDCLSFLGLFLG